MVNSHLMAITPAMGWIGVAMVGLLGYMNLSLVPSSATTVAAGPGT